MGNKKEKQIVVLISILLITSLFVYRWPESIDISKLSSLREYIGSIDAYSLVRTQKLDDEIYSVFNLNDYADAFYGINKDDIKLNLIDYNFILNKVSSAHSSYIDILIQDWQFNKLGWYRLRMNRDK